MVPHKRETERAGSSVMASKAGTRPRPDSAVDVYIAALPPTHRAGLEKLRAQVRAAAPGALEKMAYGIPTFTCDGRNLVHLAAFKAHLSFFPGSAAVTAALADGLEGYEIRKGTIRFQPDRPIPAAMVKRIVKMRVAENKALAAARAKPAKKAAPTKKARA